MLCSSAACVGVRAASLPRFFYFSSTGLNGRNDLFVVACMRPGVVPSGE
jgi:hypothetical protein